MGLEKDVGRVEGLLESVIKNQKTLFKKIETTHGWIDNINKDHELEQKEIKIFMGSIQKRLETIIQPCSYLKVTQQELTDHKEEHSNAVKKTAVRVTAVTLIVNAIALVLSKGQEWWHNWWFGIK